MKTSLNSISFYFVDVGLCEPYFSMPASPKLNAGGQGVTLKLSHTDAKLAGGLLTTESLRHFRSVERTQRRGECAERLAAHAAFVLFSGCRNLGKH